MDIRCFWRCPKASLSAIDIQLMKLMASYRKMAILTSGKMREQSLYFAQGIYDIGK